jgi:hypothetical protein
MEGTLDKFIGESGVVNIMAPLPAGENSVLPITFVAETLAHTEEPN